MFPVYRKNLQNSFSAANSSLFTNPMTSFNIIICHINVNVSKNFSDWFFQLINYDAVQNASDNYIVPSTVLF